MEPRAKPIIRRFITMGDSLSDRGTMYRRKLLGFIPMRWLAGVPPTHRFTNGYTWDDQVSAKFANEFIIKELRSKNPQIKKNDIHIEGLDLEGNNNENNPPSNLTNSDIAEAVIDQDPRVESSAHKAYDLNKDKFVKYYQQNFFRTYNEGGLTAHDYSWWPSKSISRFFSRLILSTLEKKRKELLDYDRWHRPSAIDKKETLIIEWSGANDLITVNAEPSHAEADRAIQDRIANAEKLIKNGYRHFILFNLPDLSLTPRYQDKKRKTDDDRIHASECCDYFNRELEKKTNDLLAEYKRKYPDLTIEVCDVNTKFKDIYNNPEKYKLEKNKLKQPFNDVKKDHQILPNGTIPSEGYMFSDDVHPTADVHAILANEFYDKYQNRYNFEEPKKDAKALCASFLNEYTAKFIKDRLYGFFGMFRRSNLKAFNEYDHWHELCLMSKLPPPDQAPKDTSIITAEGLHQFNKDTNQYVRVIDAAQLKNMKLGSYIQQANNIKNSKSIKHSLTINQLKEINTHVKTKGGHSHLKDIDHNVQLVKILEHALFEGGNRTRKVITDLGWINAAGEINEIIPALKEAKLELEKLRLNQAPRIGKQN